MANAQLVLTDSGGIHQEETTILGVPFDRLRTGLRTSVREMKKKISENLS
jgi:UDP-N-acetylglucosamine 2-epimerase